MAASFTTLLALEGLLFAIDTNAPANNNPPRARRVVKEAANVLGFISGFSGEMDDLLAPVLDGDVAMAEMEISKITAWTRCLWRKDEGGGVDSKKEGGMEKEEEIRWGCCWEAGG
ncbi:hypothetical protein TB2_021116 [Malus domestica]